MTTVMDFGQETLLCLYPDCKATRLFPEDQTKPPFCEEHTRLVRFLFMVHQQIPHILQQPPQTHSGLIVPNVVPPKDLAPAGMKPVIKS